MKILACVIVICFSLPSNAQDKDSWRRLSSTEQDSIDDLYGESYASECEKVLLPLNKEANRIEDEFTDSSSFTMHEISDLGEEGTFCFRGDNLVKIQVTLLYEAHRDTVEYFFKADNLFLIRQTELRYNASIIEPEFEEERSEAYHTTVAVLNDEAILHKVHEDCGAPDDPEYVEYRQKVYLEMLNTILSKTGHSQSE